MSKFFSDLARGAESILESVDRQAATISEDLKDTPLKVMFVVTITTHVTTQHNTTHTMQVQVGKEHS